MDPSPTNTDQGRPLSDRRFEELCATLHELEQTHACPDHPGIIHLKWLIANHLAEMDAAMLNASAHGATNSRNRSGRIDI